MNIVNTISSIYSFNAFSRIQVKNLEFLDFQSLGRSASLYELPSFGI